MITPDQVQQIIGISVQVVEFINALRHAQDDFLELIAEAQCLRISIQTLYSPACLDTLYLYLSKSQERDLQTIVDNTRISMKDMNVFLGKYKAVVSKQHSRLKKRSFQQKVKDLLAKTWATLCVAITDMQPFRDKLVLPTASINCFLTSITHVGLVNMSQLLAGTVVLPSSDGRLPSQFNSNLSSPSLAGWSVKGKHIAFKTSRVISQKQLTQSVEEEVIKYVEHLIKGGRPIAWAEVTPGTEKTAGILGDLSVVRRKSVHVPGKVGLKVKTVHDRDEFPLAEARRRKAMADDMLESLPRARAASVIGWHDDDASTESLSEQSEIRRRADGRKEAESAPFRRYTDAPWREKASSENRDRQYSSFRKSKEEYEDEVRHEQQLATEEALRESRRTYLPEIRRERASRRYESRMSESHTTAPATEQEVASDDEDVDEIEALICSLRDDYGVNIDVLALDSRPPVDNGEVRVAKPKSSFGKLHKSERVGQSKINEIYEESSSSDDDEPAIPPEPVSHSDRLRSQTSIKMGVDGGKRGPVRHERRTYRSQPYEYTSRDRRADPDFYSRRRQKSGFDDDDDGGDDDFDNFVEFRPRRPNGPPDKPRGSGSGGGAYFVVQNDNNTSKRREASQPQQREEYLSPPRVVYPVKRGSVDRRASYQKAAIEDMDDHYMSGARSPGGSDTAFEIRRRDGNE